jgi:hypothetical protein
LAAEHRLLIGANPKNLNNCSHDRGLAACAVARQPADCRVDPTEMDPPCLLCRLLARPSVARAVDEARPFFQCYPYREALEPRFIG